MSAGAQALWWLALPVLLLPVWWHRRKRQRVKSEPLATARFLPAAPPQTARVWRWEEVVLLALRCLLLAALIAWLAAVSMPWRGDTVFIDAELVQDAREAALAADTAGRSEAPAAAPRRVTPGGLTRPTPGASVVADTSSPSSAAWVEQQIAAAGLGGAARVALPADVLHWLPANEHQWRPGARMLVLAASVALPAQAPALAHAVDIRIAPAAPLATPAAAGASAASRAALAANTAVAASVSASVSASPPSVPVPVETGKNPAALPERRIVLAAPPQRMAAWRALFAAAEAAGGGRVVMESAPHTDTELIVWDLPGAPPAAWAAPLWWLPPAAQLAAFGTPAASFATQPATLSATQSGTQPVTLSTTQSDALPDASSVPLRINGIDLRIVDSARGRLWISPAMPPRDADTARALYETWQALARPVQPYPMPAMQLAATRSAPLAMPGTPPAQWLAYVLFALFALERLMTHVRRR